jgi:cytochrome c-type biogenesis protein CcmF
VFSWALLSGLVVAAFFFGLMLGPANPFKLVQGPVPLDGRGPNPLLQNHPLMAFHPPILYLGYVGFTVPFAFAVGCSAPSRTSTPSTRRESSPTCGTGNCSTTTR